MKNALFLFLMTCMLMACQTSYSPSVQSSNEYKVRQFNLCGPTLAHLNTEPGRNGKLTPLFKGLEVYEFNITTRSKKARKYFNQGFILNYGFNHAEAARSFREAIRLDPDCAMCYWGLGYVLGPNYNAGMDGDVLPAANEAIAKAMLLMGKVTEKEQALIKALSKRYPKSKDIDPAPFYQAYADAMRQVAKEYPDDPDVLVMTAESLMNLHPWDIWTKEGEPQPWTEEITILLDRVLELDPNHPQGMHLSIHGYEASANPEKVLAAADKLRFRVPGSGHLLHMPSHLYINTGHYHEGTLANERAVKEDSSYVEMCHAAGIYPLAYYPHNWHFLAACAALEGNGVRALEASRYMADYCVDQELMRDPTWGTLQHYYTIPLYIMVKFAMWDEILAEPKPGNDLKFPQAVWHYARGMAQAGKGQIEDAEGSLAALKELMKDEGVQQLTIWDINTVMDVLNIAENVLGGEIAFRKGNVKESIDLLTKAVELEDNLNYQEPPDWFFSVRHLLGHVLLKAEKFQEAQEIYEQDLKKLKNNGWALKGLQASLELQEKYVEAAEAKKRFETAWQHANIELKSSVID